MVLVKPFVIDRFLEIQGDSSSSSSVLQKKTQHYEHKIQYLKGLLREDPTMDTPVPVSNDFDSHSKASDGSDKF
ncbi:hypothetical protein Pyn_17354 [Prunus yedoensis var. nudiflora]|uniref:Uncharacterized protein n=1 Tax=Prunus yedoensis var. nudiflora TaxID=2094558 RepID=A0A314URB6_PRUYE|nr:hypothetical protein Pyn_17354 [Prunus yedoensis var. nudiflora]